MKIRFLLDEHMPKELIKSVKRYDEQIDILRIGLEGGPSFSKTYRFMPRHKACLVPASPRPVSPAPRGPGQS